MLTHEEMLQCVGSDAYGSDGEKIGRVGQVYMDDQTDEPAWATVNTGFFGTRESFVPLSNASFDGGALSIAYPKDQVKDAPTVGDDDGHLSPEDEGELYSYYGIGYTPWADDTSSEYVGTTTTTTETAVAADPPDDAMTLSEEQVRVAGTERRPIMKARLRKIVETEYVTQTVPVRRERIVVENVPIDEADSASDVSGAGFVSGDVGETPEVIVHEEVPVLTTEIRPVERVRLTTEQYTSEEVVETDVRREQVNVEGEMTDASDSGVTDDQQRDT